MKSRTALLCLFTALLTVSIGATASAATREDQQLRKVTVALIAADATAQAMYAKHRGYFRRRGLDVEILVVADGNLVRAALLSGQAQFAPVPVATLAQAKSNGAPLRAIAGGSLYEPGVPTTSLLAAPGERIRTPRDLVGKRIALDSRNSIADVGLRKWLKRGGVSEEDVDLVFGSFSLNVSPLLRGQIAAALLPEPQTTVAIRGGARRFARPFDAVCARECQVTLWIARKDMEPDLSARFRVAVQDAAVWANQKRNHAASARILARYAPIPEGIRSRMTRSKYSTRLRLPLGQPWIDVFKEFDLLPDDYPVGDLVK
jgi:NitT/TauT family transport system substrate-binding protein